MTASFLIGGNSSTPVDTGSPKLVKILNSNLKAAHNHTSLWLKIQFYVKMMNNKVGFLFFTTGFDVQKFLFHAAPSHCSQQFPVNEFVTKW